MSMRICIYMHVYIYICICTYPYPYVHTTVVVFSYEFVNFLNFNELLHELAVWEKTYLANKYCAVIVVLTIETCLYWRN